MRLLGLLAEATRIGRSSVAPCPVPCNYGREQRPGSPASAPAWDTAILRRQQECKRLAKTKGTKPPESFPLERSLTGTTGMFLEANGTREKLKRMKSSTPVHSFRLELLQERRCRGYERKAEHQRGASLKVGAVGMGPRFPSGEAPSLPEETSCQVWLSSSLPQVYK